MKFTEIQNKIVNGNWSEIEGVIKTDYVPICVKQNMSQQSVAINPETKEYYNNLINIKNGYATLNRAENEINLLYLLCYLYTNIEFENDNFGDQEYDFLAKNKFKEWLCKKTDAYSFEQIFRGEVLDELRRINSTMSFDIDGFKEAMKQLNNLDPDVREALKALNPTALNAAREMVKNDNNTKLAST